MTSNVPVADGVGVDGNDVECIMEIKKMGMHSFPSMCVRWRRRVCVQYVSRNNKGESHNRRTPH